MGDNKTSNPFDKTSLNGNIFKLYSRIKAGLRCLAWARRFGPSQAENSILATMGFPLQ